MGFNPAYLRWALGWLPLQLFQFGVCSHAVSKASWWKTAEWMEFGRMQKCQGTQLKNDIVSGSQVGYCFRK